MKLVFSKHIFEKYSNIKIHKNPSCSNRAVHTEGRRHTDSHDEPNTVDAFRNFAKAPINYGTETD